MDSKIKNTLFGTNSIPLVVMDTNTLFFLDILSSLPKAREIGARPDEIDSRQLYTF